MFNVSIGATIRPAKLRAISIGFTNIDDEGQEGMELAFNHWLAGESGAKRVLKDRLGRSVENVESIRPAASRQRPAHKH